MTCWYIIGRVPFHHASQGVCMQFQPWRVISALVFPLSHLFPKAGVNQQNYWNVAVWNRSLSPYDNISMDTEWLWKVAWTGVVLYLGYHSKVTSRSYQDHQKVKLMKHFFLVFIYSKPIRGEGEFYKWLLLTHFWSDIISPRISNMQFHP